MPTLARWMMTTAIAKLVRLYSRDAAAGFTSGIGSSACHSPQNHVKAMVGELAQTSSSRSLMTRQRARVTPSSRHLAHAVARYWQTDRLCRYFFVGGSHSAKSFGRVAGQRL
jgi:hypothetical protein